MRTGDGKAVENARWGLRRYVLKSIAALALVLVASPVRADGDQSLLLEVYVNGQTTGKIGEFVLRAKELMARRSELEDLGFRLPAPPVDSNHSAAPDLVPLSGIPGLTLRIDAATQTLFIAVPNDRLIPTSLQADDELMPRARLRVESGTGMTMNYDVTSTFTKGQKSLSGAMDLRAFSPHGVFSSGMLGFVGGGAGGSVTGTHVRLDSTYTFGNVDTLQRYSAGDFITTGLSWTRPVRLEGLQIRSDFNLRPDLITFPLPTVKGSVAVPSAVDVLTDGNLAISRQIAAGPFEIPELPVASGAGTISLTVTNALGQQVRIAQPFYAGAALLRPGLQNFSVQAGLVRLNWGVVSNQYGNFAIVSTYRLGMTRKFTLEADAETAGGAVMTGGGGLLQVGNLGIVNFAAAMSGGTNGPGGQFTIGVQRLGRSFSAGASAMGASSEFRDVASANGEPVPHRQLSANLSFSRRQLGSLGLFYAGLSRPSWISPVTQTLTQAQQTQVLSASYSRSLRHVTVFVNGLQDFANDKHPSVQIGLTIPLGRRDSAELLYGSEGAGQGQFQVQRTATEVGEWGYQAYAAAGGGTHMFGQTQYKSRWSLLTAGVDRIGGTNTLRLQTQGAVSMIDGGLFLSNSIFDSFAIVDTGTAARIHVLEENRVVGRTGASGRLLVPDLRSYDLNRLGIVPTDVGLDTTIQQVVRTVRPQDRSGVVVRFAVTISHAALLILVDQKGAPVPVGSTARLRRDSKPVPVGYDGQMYLDNLRSINEVEVQLPDGRVCAAAFDYQPIPGEIPKIGPLSCIIELPRSMSRSNPKSRLRSNPVSRPTPKAEPNALPLDPVTQP